MRTHAILALLGPLVSANAFLLPSSSSCPKALNKPAVAATAATAALRQRGAPTALFAKKGADKGKKKPAPAMQIKHWDEDDEPEFVLIEDSKEGASINCTAETLVTRGDKQYVIALPIDTPVVVVDEKYNALEMGFDTRLPKMLPTVEKLLAEMGANLQRTAGTLTIEGDVEIYDEEGEFGDEGEADPMEDDEADDGSPIFVEEVDPDFADRPAPPQVKEEYYDFDARDDSYLDDEEEDMEDMAEPILDFEHEGKTYTLMKFVQPYFVVARKDGGGGKWELLQGDKAEQVFDWVLESDLDMEFDLLESEGLGE